MPCTVGLPLATQSWRSPPLRGRAVGVVWLVSTGFHGPEHPGGPESTSQVVPVWWKRTADELGTPGCGHARRRVHDDVEAGVLLHGDVDVHGVREGVRLGGVTQREHGRAGARNGGGRRVRGGADQGGGHHEEKGEQRSGHEHHAAPRDIGSEEHDPTSVEVSPGEIGA